jgi:hypothetical protein
MQEVIHYVLRFHKVINCIWNKEEFPEQWKGPVIVPIYKNDYKTD